MAIQLLDNMIDYRKLFADFNIPYSDRVNRGWVNITCPFCNDRTFNGGFNEAHDYYNCWKCGSHSHILALSKILHLPRNTVVELLEEYQSRSIALNSLNDKKVALATHLDLPTDTFTSVERKYLLKRNFDPDYLNRKYRVVGGGITGAWKYRIIIPLLLNGRVVSWTGRSILSKEKQKELKIPRYKNLSIQQSVVDPKHILYNLDNATGHTVVLTEGAFDVMRLGDGFVSSFGTELTQEQLRQLKTRFSKVFIMFDNEEKAQEKARKFGYQLVSMGIDTEIVDAYSDYNKNDGAELTPDEVRYIRRELGLYA